MREFHMKHSICGWHGVTGCDPQTKQQQGLLSDTERHVLPCAQQRVLCYLLHALHQSNKRAKNIFKNVSDVRLFSRHTGYYDR